MAYAYILRTYGRAFQPGDRVRHSVTGRIGEVRRTVGDPAYVSVKFDDVPFKRRCHPLELDRDDKMED